MHPLPLATFVGFFALLIAATCSNAAEPDHPIVPGFERFFANENSDAAAGGQLLIGELNCTSCHKSDATPTIAAKQAPLLDEVASRVKPSYLRNFLADPHGTKPGTTMPDLFHGLSEKERGEQVEAIVHFLVSTTGGEPAQAFPNVGAAVKGEALFHQAGCVACHGPQREGAPQLATSVPLGDLMEKYTLPSLTDFLRDPQHTRPSGRMPSLNLSGQEARDIASYLLKGLPEVANLTVKYYEGSWQETPDFGKLEPKTTSGADKIDVSYRQRDNQFGLRFEGFLPIDTEGEYTFHIGSDDGSRITIDGQVVANNGGVHPYGIKSGKVKLTKGWHEVVIDYFEQGGEEKLTAEYEGSGVPRQPIAGAMSILKESPSAEPLGIAVKPELAAKGRALFATIGCASCHQLKKNDARIESKLTAKKLDQLDTNAGCLQASPSKNLPRFQLSAQQRTALSAALKNQSVKQTDAQKIANTLTIFNCYACHSRDEVGGVEEERNTFFQTPIQEMGDEGRIPPALDGVGAKLTTNWLNHVLADGANDRPYMLTRMPKFGLQNVGQLTAALENVDTLEPAPDVSFSEPIKKVKAAGRMMVGDKGFSCIKCHTFGEFEATGLQSIDLKTMPERLREDWFRRYLKNPQVFRRGTRMPSSWPPVGPSLLPDILDGDSEQQIAAVWLYLSDGPRAKLPTGLVRQSNELIPIDEAIIYRNFIDGGGPRAIGVGYPEGINLAFDANNMRLAMLWQGRFIDASRHWSGRGQGFEPPAGENVLKFSDAPSFAILESLDAAWPTQPAKEIGYRFRGYRLTADQRPTFLYSFDGVSIEDFFDSETPAADIPLERTLKLTSDATVENLWLRAAVGNGIQAEADGWYAVDGTWRVRITADMKPQIRRSNNKDELLVPVTFKDGQAKIVEQFRW